MKNQLLLWAFVAMFTACQTAENKEASPSDQEEIAVNPAAPGFNEAASDPEAIAIADEVMEAMGGRAAWDRTQFIYWSFFGRRTLLWDKFNQRVRINVPGDSMLYLIDLAEGTGMVMKNGEALEQLDSLAKYVKQGQSIWINDAYWLVMPYKLKDSGVTLKYVGQGTTQNGKTAEVVMLTFERVGDTPQNKYKVYVDPESKLVIQWDFYSDAADEQPRFTTPWEGYQDFHGILLSAGRGENSLSEIAVYSKVPTTAFTDFASPAMETFE